MNLDDVKRILELVKEHELSEFELENEGLKIRVRKDARGRLVAEAPPVQHHAAAPAPQPVHVATTGVPVAAPAALADEAAEFAIVKSPIVGTFYRAPEPGAPPFADIGARVKKGQVLCIIEAMKLMNEIESEYDGEIVKAYVENGQPVQYGERLFAIKSAS
ncbi:MAG: acetyl-CoA carboxylase biotin carboxyl carrier protein [Acidobacteria bacterium]|nr:acetyl-CoA carboxylase biotin carboxyl carrier protein [Acidobacteriota bacterium]